MTDTYRVIVVRERMVRRGILGGAPIELPADVLFEAAGPDPSRLLGYAPDEVEQALKAASETPAEPEQVPPLVDVEALAAGGVIGLGPGSVVPVGETPAANDKPKRTRRTKAEIAAAKAAEQAGAAAPAAVGPRVGDEPTATHPATEPAAPQAIAEPAPEQQSAATPAAAYNPFA